MEVPVRNRLRPCEAACLTASARRQGRCLRLGAPLQAAWGRAPGVGGFGRCGRGGGGAGAHILRQFAALAVQPQPHEHREANHLHGHLRPAPPRTAMAPFS